MIPRLDCPVCNRPLPEDQTAVHRDFPFCSSRCRQIDLFRWFEGRYAIVEELDPEFSMETSDFPRPPESPDH